MDVQWSTQVVGFHLYITCCCCRSCRLSAVRRLEIELWTVGSCLHALQTISNTRLLFSIGNLEKLWRTRLSERSRANSLLVSRHHSLWTPVWTPESYSGGANTNRFDTRVTQGTSRRKRTNCRQRLAESTSSFTYNRLTHFHFSLS